MLHGTRDYELTLLYQLALLTRTMGGGSVAIGPSGHRITIPVIAAVIDPIWKKSACFDRLEHTLRQQLHSHSVAEIITALDESLPIDTTVATENALSTRNKIIDGATKIANLEPVAFLGKDEAGIDVEDPAVDKRPEDISYIRLRCRLEGRAQDSQIQQPPLHFEFSLALPQSRRDTSTGVVETMFGQLNSHSSATAAPTINTPSKQSRLFKAVQRNNTPKYTVSWYGDASFLDDEEVFAKEFGTDNPPILHTNPRTGDKTETLQTLHEYASLCQFDVALALCRYDYVGSTNVIDSTLAVQEVCKEIGSIQQEYRERNGKKNIRCPDEMYTKYLELTPSLPDDTKLWTIRLCSTYFNALMNDLKDRMLGGTFRLPPPPAQNTKDLELSALRQVREAAVVSYKKLADELSVMSKFLSNQSPTSSRLSGKHLLCAALLDNPDPVPEQAEINPQALFHGGHPQGQVYKFSSVSPAETTLNRYKSPSDRRNYTPNNDIPTRKRADGQRYPYHPDDPSFLSKFPLGFRGCYRCGRTDHFRKDRCPIPDTAAVTEEFFKELHAHKPHLKKSNRNAGRMNVTQGLDAYGPPQLPPTPNGNPMLRPNPGVSFEIQRTTGDRVADNTPAWLTQMQRDQSHDSEGREQLESILKKRETKGVVKEDDASKRARLWVYSAKVLVSKGALHNLRKMPLALDNDLPGIVFRVGGSPEAERSFLCHIDTCAAMNTGNLAVHQYLMTKHPELVISYSRYDDKNPFLPIELQCAVTEANSTHGHDDSNKLIAVVTYRTPYVDQGGKPITLSLGLGTNVSVRTIIGLPTLKQWKGVVDLVENTFTSHAFSRKFDLVFEEAEQGLPEGVQFQTSDFKRPHQSSDGTMLKIAAKAQEARLLDSVLTDGCDEVLDNDDPNTSNKNEGIKK